MMPDELEFISLVLSLTRPILFPGEAMVLVPVGLRKSLMRFTFFLVGHYTTSLHQPSVPATWESPESHVWGSINLRTEFYSLSVLCVYPWWRCAGPCCRKEEVEEVWKLPKKGNGKEGK